MKTSVYCFFISLIFLFILNSKAQDSLSYIVIRDAPNGGGKEVQRWLRSDDGSIRLYCAGYDVNGNFMDNVPVLWEVSLDYGNLVISTDISDSLLVLNDDPAIRIDNVLAYHPDLNLQDTTGVLYLVNNSLDAIQIRTAPDGGGSEVGDFSMNNSGEISFYAAGYDTSGNFICNQIVKWYTTGNLDWVEVIDTMLVFMPTTAPTTGTIGAAVDNISDNTGTINIVEYPADINTHNPHPAKYKLEQAYPNPFNPNTVIGYRLSADSDVDLSIFNLLGQKVTTLVSGRQNAGIYKVEWDASGFASGVYYYCIQAGEFHDVKKMILIR